MVVVQQTLVFHRWMNYQSATGRKDTPVGDMILRDALVGILLGVHMGELDSRRIRLYYRPD